MRSSPARLISLMSRNSVSIFLRAGGGWGGRGPLGREGRSDGEPPRFLGEASKNPLGNPRKGGRGGRGGGIMLGTRYIFVMAWHNNVSTVLRKVWSSRTTLGKPPARTPPPAPGFPAGSHPHSKTANDGNPSAAVDEGRRRRRRRRDSWLIPWPISERHVRVRSGTPSTG